MITYNHRTNKAKIYRYLYIFAFVYVLQLILAQLYNPQNSIYLFSFNYLLGIIKLILISLILINWLSKKDRGNKSELLERPDNNSKFFNRYPLSVFILIFLGSIIFIIGAFLLGNLCKSYDWVCGIGIVGLNLFLIVPISLALIISGIVILRNKQKGKTPSKKLDARVSPLWVILILIIAILIIRNKMVQIQQTHEREKAAYVKISY